MVQRERSCNFEKGRVRAPIRDEIPYHRQAVGNCVLGNHFTIYANPFAERDEVRGYEQTGAITLRATDGIDHGANGALTVRAGDVDDLNRSVRGACAPQALQAELVEQTLDIFQPQLNAEALQTIQPRERLFVGNLWIENGRDIALRCPYHKTRSLSGIHIHGVTAK